MKKSLWSLMICGFICVSFVSIGLAQTVPTAPETNTVNVNAEKSDAAPEAIKPKKHHRKHTKKSKKAKTHKKAAEKEAQTNVDTNQVNKD